MNQLDKMLIEASKNGNINLVKKLIQERTNIYPGNNEALIRAAEGGHLEVVKYLIENGANIHDKNDLALRFASEEGHLEVAKYLVENKANIHAENDEALRRAAEEGHSDVVKYLIENGAYIHTENDYALRWAAANGYLEVVKYLIENGADIHAWDDEALRWAAENGHLEVVKYLIENGADWSDIKDYLIFIELLKQETNNLKNILTNNYITLQKSSPQIDIGDNIKSQIPKSLLLKSVYEAPYQQYCSEIKGKLPPIQLIALANILQHNNWDYNLNISWVDLCNKVKNVLFLLL